MYFGGCAEKGLYARSDRICGSAEQQLVDEVDHPRIVAIVGHRGEPHLPIDSILVRRHDARTSMRAARFAAKLVRVATCAFAGSSSLVPSTMIS